MQEMRIFCRSTTRFVECPDLTDKERQVLGNDPKQIWSFILFCKLHVDLKTPDRLLEAMGFWFMYRE